MERKKLIAYIRSNDADYRMTDFNTFSDEELYSLKESVELRNLNFFSKKAMDAIFNSMSLI